MDDIFSVDILKIPIRSQDITIDADLVSPRYPLLQLFKKTKPKATIFKIVLKIES